jgi:DNA helicase-2/ATP-dependent DNA helicase PcrA
MTDTSVCNDLASAGTFFALIDEVLLEAGRAPLPPRGSQRRIIGVRPDDRVLQILAGAGSGKTEMLVWRVLFELLVLGTAANRIMVTTFTRKAATEIEVRLVERSDALLAMAHERGLPLVDPHVHDLRIGTLHSLCDSLLAEFDSTYMAAGTQVIDETEARVRMTRVHRFELGYRGGAPPKVIDRLLDTDELVSLFRPPWDGGSWPANTFDRISFLEGLIAQHTETWMPRCGAIGVANGIEEMSRPGLTDDLIKLQQRWEQYLDHHSILDFATIQRRFHGRQEAVIPFIDHIFVDEFQDTNPIQFAIHLGWLNRPDTRLTVVGDDDQALYRFRGSDISCFIGLEKSCRDLGYGYRQEKLEENWRSTKRIVDFSAAFREQTVLSKVSMPKAIRPPRTARRGHRPRLLEGPWSAVCDYVAAELWPLGVGRRVPPQNGTAAVPPSVAVLLFSTSEREGKSGGTPALQLRRTLESHGLRVYNPRNKTAASSGSPVHSLAALLSYLIDPVVVAPAGKQGTEVMVWASCNDPDKSSFSPVAPPDFPIAAAHASIQKKFRGSKTGVKYPSPEITPMLDYLDKLRDRLVAATKAHDKGTGREPRLTLSGVVARLLTFKAFREVGFTDKLFREALFTQILEANIAPTRRSTASLDRPLSPRHNSKHKIVWPDEMWSFLNIFGTLVSETKLDDIEDDTFAEDAVALLTFHQAKGLEFEHVYVGLTGRKPDPHAALQTLLFSGELVQYTVDANGQPMCIDPQVTELALADRERELYVAMTRARDNLTFLHDPADTRPMTELNPGIASLFESATGYKYDDVTEWSWTP